MMSNDAQIRAGSHKVTWDGFDVSGNLVPTGLYIYRLRFQVDDGEMDYYGTVGVVY